MRQVPALLRLEGLSVFIAATAAYARTDGRWMLFLLLFLAPDLFMLGYVLAEETGATVYNLGHTYAVSLPVLGLGLLWDQSFLIAAGLIWTAHIGLDRILGFGLKLPGGFKRTHLRTES